MLSIRSNRHYTSLKLEFAMPSLGATDDFKQKGLSETTPTGRNTQLKPKSYICILVSSARALTMYAMAPTSQPTPPSRPSLVQPAEVLGARSRRKKGKKKRRKNNRYPNPKVPHTSETSSKTGMSCSRTLKLQPAPSSPQQPPVSRGGQRTGSRTKSAR